MTFAAAGEHLHIGIIVALETFQRFCGSGVFYTTEQEGGIDAPGRAAVYLDPLKIGNLAFAFFYDIFESLVEFAGGSRSEFSQTFGRGNQG